MIYALVRNLSALGHRHDKISRKHFSISLKLRENFILTGFRKIHHETGNAILMGAFRGTYNRMSVDKIKGIFAQNDAMAERAKIFLQVSHRLAGLRKIKRKQRFVPAG